MKRNQFLSRSTYSFENGPFFLNFLINLSLPQVLPCTFTHTYVWCVYTCLYLQLHRANIADTQYIVYAYQHLCKPSSLKHWKM